MAARVKDFDFKPFKVNFRPFIARKRPTVYNLNCRTWRLLKFFEQGRNLFMADEDNRCAHDACNCAVGDDEEYCSPQCEAADEGGVTAISCECGHPGCV